MWRILKLGGRSVNARYRRFMEALVESAALYSVVLVIYMPFMSRAYTSISPAIIIGSNVIQSIVIPLSVSRI